MTEKPTPSDPPIPSIFDGTPETPAAGAQYIDDSQGPTVEKRVSEDGHLHASVPLGDVNPYDHSAEQDAIQDHKRNLGTAPPPMPDTSDTPIHNPGMMLNPTDQLLDEMERRFQMELGETKVVVTSADRDAFVRSALTDTELLFDIEVPGMNTVIKVAMASDEFTNSAAAAAKHWGAINFIDGDSDLQMLLAFQQIHAWYQIRAIDGVPTPWSDFWVDGMPKIREVRMMQRDPDNFEVFFQMNAVRWRMILDAIRTAELKYKICQQNWKNRSFFTGADTD